VFPEIHWQFAPLTLDLQGAANLPLERGMISATGAEMRRFLEAAGNQLTGREVAVIAPVDVRWFAIITREPAERVGRNAQREEWSEESKEADGRDVVIHTVLAPAGDALFRFEMLAEKAAAEKARAEFDAVLGRITTAHKEREPRWWIPPGLALGALGLIWMVRRRRQRGL